LRAVQRVPHGLGGRAQVGVVGAALGLRDQRDDGALDPRARQRILQRLLDHVAHPARGRRDQHAERQRLDLAGGDLVARQLVAHLGAVAVHEGDVPPRARQLDDGGEALARMPELIGDGRPLALRGDGIAAQRDDDRARPRIHGGAT